MRQGSRRASNRTIFKLALIGFAAAALFGVLRATMLETPVGPRPINVFTTTFWPPENSLENAIIVADGQAWGTIAEDPTLSEPERFTDGAPELVYRGQRPLVGWVVWGLSLGQPALVPYALFLCTAASVGLLVAATALLARQQGRRPQLALLVLPLPGVLLSAVLFAPDPLPVALAVLGVYGWLIGTRRARWWAIAALAGAVLGREVLAVVPVFLALQQVTVGRRRIRDTLPLALTLVPLVAWIGSLRLRYGLWPTAADQVERATAPFVGWAHAIDHIEGLAWISYVLAVGLLVGAVVRDWRSPLTWVACSFALLTIVTGENVLSTEPYRPFLALYVFALIVNLPDDASAPKTSVTRRAAASPTTEHGRG